MLTRIQRSLLQITALICAGFMLGIAAKSPSVNPLLDPTLVNTSPAIVSAAAQDASQAENLIGDQPNQRLARDGAIDCSDLDSASCLDLRQSYKRYLSGNWDQNSEYVPTPPATTGDCMPHQLQTTLPQRLQPSQTPSDCPHAGPASFRPQQSPSCPRTVRRLSCRRPGRSPAVQTAMSRNVVGSLDTSFNQVQPVQSIGANSVPDADAGTSCPPSEPRS